MVKQRKSPISILTPIEEFFLVCPECRKLQRIPIDSPQHMCSCGKTVWVNTTSAKDESL